jgi:mycothiol synthase
VALLGYDDGRLIGCAIITPGVDGAAALHVAIDPAHRAGGSRADGAWDELVGRALQEVDGRSRLWIMQADRDPKADLRAARHGFAPERDLLQMRVPLPLDPAQQAAADSPPLTTRPFRPGLDDERWIAINNDAFAGHPEQGGWTSEDLAERLEAPWFDAQGFLVAEDGAGDLMGSCWTKVHRDTQPAMGEIYVISVAPSHHGEGLGRALTVAGLAWLAATGLTVGMLYTTDSNTAAVALYTSLGFTVDHVDRAYLTDGPAPAGPNG